MNDFFRAGLADLAAQVEPVDLYPRVLVASRRRTRRRTAAALVAVAVLSGGTVAATTLYAGRSRSPVVTSSASASASGPAVASPTAARSAPKVDVGNSSFELPELVLCTAGRRTFVDGVEKDPPYNRLSVSELSPPVRADLDGVPGDELVVLVSCRIDGIFTRDQLLALTVADGTLRPLGFVLDPATFAFGPSIDPAHVSVRGDVVTVRIEGRGNDDGAERIEPEERGFAYRDGAFVQVSGPTFPPPPLPPRSA
ncbi:hypothetical protein [Catellatospora chokoriensis]|uniref:Uncharacterized protein n=1 Tax=Catellatospora chokoriensis TaxID=310353 RepID=A0A8J3K3M8_9ACTN|nr:hypothetical protein [Catellatospora chokoriensis]GIF92506.1 hypothetical protein Cch02nite_59500 [Catellatospora chokoriensis]